jgi:hypothetical protein
VTADELLLDHFRLGFRLTVTSLVVVIIHTADSEAAGVAACRLISSNMVQSGC